MTDKLAAKKDSKSVVQIRSPSQSSQVSPSDRPSQLLGPPTTFSENSQSSDKTPGKGRAKFSCIGSPGSEDGGGGSRLEKRTPRRRKSNTTDGAPSVPQTATITTPSGSVVNVHVPLSERQQLALLMQMTAEPAQEKTASHTSTPTRKGEKVAKINKRNERGETPLHIAAIRGDIDGIRNLLQEGADPNGTDYAGWSALHEACNHGWIVVAKILLKAGADANARGLDNDTPLHDAVVNENIELVRMLMRFGADPYLKNRDGDMPLHLTQSEELIKIMKAESVSSSSEGSSVVGITSPESNLSAAHYDDHHESHGQKASPNTPILKRPPHAGHKSEKTVSPKLTVKLNTGKSSAKEESRNIPDGSVHAVSSGHIISATAFTKGTPYGSSHRSDANPKSSSSSSLPPAASSASSSAPAASSVQVSCDTPPPKPAGLPKKTISSVALDRSSALSSKAKPESYAFEDISDNETQDPDVSTRCEERPGKEESKRSSVDVTRACVTTGGTTYSKPVVASALPQKQLPVTNTANCEMLLATSSITSTVQSAGLTVSHPMKLDPIQGDGDGAETSGLSPLDEKTPKVPPLKIIIPPSKSNNVNNEADRQRQAPIKQSLPYVVKREAASAEAEVNPSPKSHSVGSSSEMKQDVSDAVKEKPAAEEQRTQPRMTRSRAQNQSAAPDGGGSSSVQAEARDKDEAVADHPVGTAPAPGSAAAAGASAKKTSVSGNKLVSMKRAASVSTSPAGDDAPATAASGAAAAAEGGTTVPHRKRKLRQREVVAASTIKAAAAAAEHSAAASLSAWSAASSSSGPVDCKPMNSINTFLEVRKQVHAKFDRMREEERMVREEYQHPPGFRKFLINSEAYICHRNVTSRLSIPMLSPPPSLHSGLREMFQEQEKERYDLRLQHQMQRDHLIITTEQAVVRCYVNKARAIVGQTTPFSAIQMLRDIEIYNTIEPDQIMKQYEKEKTSRPRFNGRQFQQTLQDTKDVYEKLKEQMVLRHHNEAESLHAVQRMDWSWRMKELGLCEMKAKPVIDDVSLPMVQVTEDFDLLPR